MLPRYQELLATLRRQFPQPVSDPVHDAYFVFTILRALDQVDALKSQMPMLGGPREPDYSKAIGSRLAPTGQSLEAVVPQLVAQLQGMFLWGHPQSQVNVITHPSIAGIIGVLLASTYNPNLCSDESGRGFSEAEVKASSMAAALVGYDADRAGGVFTFGGTGCLFYGIKIGLEKAVPGAMRRGVREPVVVLASEHCHYAVLNAAGWLGIGQDSVVRVPTHLDNSLDVDCAGQNGARQALAEGKRIAAIVATMGSTDAFGLDDLRAYDRYAIYSSTSSSLITCRTSTLTP
ncbi:MAG: hypothetical protein QM775_16335 [Pirellulales bacterium]